MIKDNLKDVQNRIKLAAKKAGRDPNDITLVCVTKGADPYMVSEVLVHGVKDLGENRVQEAVEKKSQVMPGARWHLVGHLQANKAKDAVKIFDLIHSVDSAELLKKIDREAQKIGKVMDVLVQINTSGEESKYGIRPEEALGLMREASALPNVRVVGLMTIAPLSDDPQTARPYMASLRGISETVKREAIPNIDMRYLSMGMSQDFEVAIQEGANMVRIGTAIFKEKD